MKQAAVFLLGLFVGPEDGGIKLLQKHGELPPDYTASHPRKLITFIVIRLVTMRTANPKKKISLVLRCTMMREFKMQCLNCKINYNLFVLLFKMHQLEEELTSLHFKLAL
jgi:hypothetical protein